MPLDDATTAFIAQVSQARPRPLTEMAPDEVRLGTARLRALYGTGPGMQRTEDVRVGEGEHAFDVRVLVPNQAPSGVILYFHGGGWVTGDIDDFDVLGRKVAERTGCAVLLVNYRLAPEHRFPAAVNDACAALHWADANIEAIAGRQVPLVLLGDSAGGNLAAVAAHRARDAGLSVAMQVLLYPVTDSDFNRPTYTDPKNQLLLNRASMVWFWDHYLPDACMRLQPDASPLRSTNFQVLPPTLILTAEFDPLREEGEAYAAKLVAAGVPVEFERYAGQMHGFFSMVNVLPGSERAINHVARFIRERLSR
ncbi:alpha/beta hydrolase [Noviherbaspirillum sedimenti]|uniref:Alpha/beta hydrolase n=1 Tax=Noviherbaspirillum sedimenti TaxID=2320865 RepID=A0A3A3GPC7_9BURK|nr:alpha/beta hydrolase [Noviherbaspirillum sedimenti]RJG04186.1 alpha/beta hydrolase [Noviherbaspirillum sedimenti]